MYAHPLSCSPIRCAKVFPLSVASMVFPGGHCREATPIRVRNMRGRAEQGAVLHLPAIRLGRHSAHIYSTKARCAIRSELLRKVQPCVHLRFCKQGNFGCDLLSVVVNFFPKQLSAQHYTSPSMHGPAASDNKRDEKCCGSCKPPGGTGKTATKAVVIQGKGRWSAE